MFYFFLEKKFLYLYKVYSTLFVPFDRVDKNVYRINKKNFLERMQSDKRWFSWKVGKNRLLSYLWLWQIYNETKFFR